MWEPVFWENQQVKASGVFGFIPPGVLMFIWAVTARSWAGPSLPLPALLKELTGAW